MTNQDKITAISPDNILRASERAHRISLDLHAGFWLEGENDISAQQRIDDARKSLEVLAGYLGARVVYDAEGGA